MTEGRSGLGPRILYLLKISPQWQMEYAALRATREPVDPLLMGLVHVPGSGAPRERKVSSAVITGHLTETSLPTSEQFTNLNT